jgi:hypothetical protein
MRSRPLHRIVAVLGLALAAAGRAETFDVTSFTAPPGWARENKGGVVVFSRQGEDGGSCLAAIYASREGSGDAERDFREEWDLVVSKQLRFQTPPEVERSQAGSWTRLVGTIETLQDGREARTELHVSSGGRRVASLLSNRSDDSCADELSAFVPSRSRARPPAPCPRRHRRRRRPARTARRRPSPGRSRWASGWAPPPARSPSTPSRARAGPSASTP